MTEKHFFNTDDLNKGIFSSSYALLSLLKALKPVELTKDEIKKQILEDDSFSKQELEQFVNDDKQMELLYRFLNPSILMNTDNMADKAYYVTAFYMFLNKANTMSYTELETELLASSHKDFKEFAKDKTAMETLLKRLNEHVYW